MIFKGFKFRKSRTVVQIPTKDDAGVVYGFVESDRDGYIHFGKVIKVGSTLSGNCIKTKYTWRDGAPVYAKPIKLKGHSLCNMAYGDDGKVYLMFDGKMYTAVLPTNS